MCYLSNDIKLLSGFYYHGQIEHLAPLYLKNDCLIKPLIVAERVGTREHFQVS